MYLYFYLLTGYYLVISGPRFVLNLIRVFEGSFGGPTLYENPHYQSPNEVRHKTNMYFQDTCRRYKECCFSCNLGQNKKEQQTPIPAPPPQIKDESAQKPKRSISASLIWGGGGAGEGVQIFHLFCPRLWIITVNGRQWFLPVVSQPPSSLCRRKFWLCTLLPPPFWKTRGLWGRSSRSCSSTQVPSAEKFQSVALWEKKGGKIPYMLTLHVNWKVSLHIHVFLKMGVSITRLSFFAVELTYFFFLSIVGWFVNKLPSGIVIAWSRGKLLRIAGKPTKIFLMTFMTSMTCFIRLPNQTLILPRQESVPRKCRMKEEDSEECERKASVWTHRTGCVDDRKGSSLIWCFYLHHTKHKKKRGTTCPMIDCSLQRCVNLVSGWVIFESNQGISWTPWYFKHLVQQDSISFITFCQKALWNKNNYTLYHKFTDLGKLFSGQ